MSHFTSCGKLQIWDQIQGETIMQNDYAKRW